MYCIVQTQRPHLMVEPTEKLVPSFVFSTSERMKPCLLGEAINRKLFIKGKRTERQKERDQQLLFASLVLKIDSSSELLLNPFLRAGHWKWKTATLLSECADRWSVSFPRIGKEKPQAQPQFPGTDWRTVNKMYVRGKCSNIIRACSWTNSDINIYLYCYTQQAWRLRFTS